ncbi:MAG: toll/interleukin-1 receptor domain-containing protein [Candidatus Entotheonellia bacterium]
MPVAIFLSHSTYDDATVAELRIALESHGVSVWADSQRLSAGEELTPRIQEAIANAQHFVVLLSPRAINSPWVHKEVQLAQTVKQSRRDGYKVIPVLYDGVTPGALPWLFDAEIVAVTLGNGPNAIAAALPDLLVALGLRLPDDPLLPTPLETVPLAELTLHLTELSA